MAVQRKDEEKQKLKVEIIYSFPERSFLHKIFQKTASIG